MTKVKPPILHPWKHGHYENAKGNLVKARKEPEVVDPQPLCKKCPNTCKQKNAQNMSRFYCAGFGGIK